MKIQKYRYFLIEFSGKFDSQLNLIRRLTKNITYIAGQISLAQASLRIIVVNKISSTRTLAIIQCSKKMKHIVEVAIILLDGEYYPEIIKVSGSIKNVKSIITNNLNPYEDLVHKNNSNEDTFPRKRVTD